MLSVLDTPIQCASPRSVRSVRSVGESSRFTDVVDDGTYLASGEVLATFVVARGHHLPAERLNAVYPAHQVFGGDTRVAVREVEQGKFLVCCSFLCS